MATVGNPTTGGDAERKIFQSFKGISITMPEAGTVTSITVQCQNTVTPGSWQAGVWNTSGTVLGSSSVRTDIGANAAYEFTGLSVVVEASTEYIFGVAADGVADDLGDAVIFSASATYDGRSAAGDADNVDPLANTTWGADSARDYHILVTYTPAGGVIHTRNMPDALSVADARLPYRLRQRHFAEALTPVTDGRFLTRILGRSAQDAAEPMVDAMHLSRLRGRVVDDAATMVDSIIVEIVSGGVIYTVILSDGTEVTDAVLLSRERGRYFSEVIALDDAGVTRIHEITRDDGVDASDQSLAYRSLFRGLDDLASLVDGFIATVSGSNIILRTLSDVVTVADELLTYRLRDRVFTNPITLSDGAVVTRERLQYLSETLQITDAQLHFLLRTIVASDPVTVNDETLAFRLRLRDMTDAFYPGDDFLASISQLVPITVEVRVRLGVASGPLLGHSNSIRLGGYN